MIDYFFFQMKKQKLPIQWDTFIQMHENNK